MCQNFQPEISGIRLKHGERDYNISICNVKLNKTKYTRVELINELVEKITEKYKTIDNFTTSIKDRFDELKDNYGKYIEELKESEDLMSFLKKLNLIGYGFTFLDVNKIKNNKNDDKNDDKNLKKTDSKNTVEKVDDDEIIDFSNYKFLDLWFKTDSESNFENYKVTFLNENGKSIENKKLLEICSEIDTIFNNKYYITERDFNDIIRDKYSNFLKYEIFSDDIKEYDPENKNVTIKINETEFIKNINIFEKYNVVFLNEDGKSIENKKLSDICSEISIIFNNKYYITEKDLSYIIKYKLNQDFEYEVFSNNNENYVPENRNVTIKINEAEFLKNLDQIIDKNINENINDTINKKESVKIETVKKTESKNNKTCCIF